MNLKQLEVFRAVMETGSTIAAATTLSVSQSAISRQLAALEDDAGINLFVRDKGRLIARPEAHALMREVEELAETMLRLRSKITNLRSGAHGDTMIKVAMAHSLANTMMPKLLKGFFAERPAVSVEVLSGPTDAVERLVRGRVADFGFVRLPAEDGTLETRPIVDSGTSCVIPVAHPLAARSEIELQDLSSIDLILLSRQRINRNELEHDLRKAASIYRCRLEVHSVETACACVSQGLGVAIVPTLIASFFRSPETVMRPFVPARIQTFGIVTMPGVPLSVSSEALIAAIAEHALRGARMDSDVTGH